MVALLYYKKFIKVVCKNDKNINKTNCEGIGK